MFIHGGELSLALAGGGPDLVWRMQPKRDQEICLRVFFTAYRSVLFGGLSLIKTGDTGTDFFLFFQQMRKNPLRS